MFRCRCDHHSSGCDFVTTTGEPTRAPLMKAMRRHWKEEHREVKLAQGESPKTLSIMPRGGRCRFILSIVSKPLNQCS